MLRHQQEDGGWASSRAIPRAASARRRFACNLVTLNRRRRDSEIGAAVEHGVRYLLAQRGPAGGWFDVLWGRSDSTSIAPWRAHAGGGGRYPGGEVQPAVRRGGAFACSIQAQDGGSYDPRFKQEKRLSPVAWTAHILPTIVAYQGDSDAARRGLVLMADAMEADGSWDGGDVDHTCESTQALILASLVLDDYRYEEKFTCGVEWLLANRNPDGLWAVAPGKSSDLLITCDGYDTLQSTGST
jgi:hypothetical protein